MTESSTVKDLGAVFDAHVKAEFIDKDVAATMATMVAEPYLTHVPTLTGGTGRLEVESFYRDHFVGHWPDDVEVKPLSRTVGHNRVVDEQMSALPTTAKCASFFRACRRQVGRLCCRMS